MLKNLSRPLFLALAVILLAAALAAGPALAQDEQPPRPVTDDEVNAVAKQLYCPVCENIPLDVCPTQACTDWREDIREKLAQGWTPDQVKTYFAERYGDRVLAAPPARGLNWLVYIIPPAAILLGAFILFRAFQSWTRAPGQAPAAAAPATDEATGAGDEYVARLEEELRKR